ncbi:hypothetical protein P8452_61507 [Trifolium repens]|nr:hypothetical protein P8452_26075 [Trifolium repens]WJX72699.1 hypothetical protein P8452_56548 [Trifolium repens]WJX78263.1 hypothetical protein P8452_61507 [Trifolium repens]
MIKLHEQMNIKRDELMARRCCDIGSECGTKVIALKSNLGGLRNWAPMHDLDEEIHPTFEEGELEVEDDE